MRSSFENISETIDGIVARNYNQNGTSRQRNLGWTQFSIGGSSVSHTFSTTDASLFYINTDGVYAISFTNDSHQLMVTKNQSFFDIQPNVGTTTIQLVNSSMVLCYELPTGSGGTFATACGVFQLNKGDFVSAWMASAVSATGTTHSVFRIERLF